MDNFALDVLIREITPALLQKRIQKVKLLSETGFALELRSRVSEFLVISLERSCPTVFIDDKVSSSHRKASDWVLTLRKYLVGGRILNLCKEFSERKVVIELESDRPSSLPEKLYLSLDLIPGRTNVSLLNENRDVLASFYPISERYGKAAGTSETRARAPWAVDRISKAEFQEWLQASGNLGRGHAGAGKTEHADGICGSLAMSRFKSGKAPMRLAGMSYYFLQEISYAGRSDPEFLWERLQTLLRRVRHGPYSPRLYYLRSSNESSAKVQPLQAGSNQGRAMHFFVSPFPLDSMCGLEHFELPSLNAAAAKLYEVTASNALLVTNQNTQISRVDQLLRRKTRLLANLQEDLKKIGGAKAYKKYADLIYAQPDKSPPGQTGVRLTDLFDPEQKEIEVPLDPRLSSIQNAVRYSKLYQKARRSVPLIVSRIKRTEQEIKALVDQKLSLAAATTIEGPHKTAPNHGSAQVVRERVTKSAQTDPTAGPNCAPKDASDSLVRKTAKSFVSSDGLTILVGKSSKDNDTLTLKIAQSDDFWLHVADYAGSHVVLKNPLKLAVPPRQSLLEAAQLAAYFSQARNASKVEVHYTQKRFVSKPKGAKPGMVRLKDYKSVSVRPELLPSNPR